MAERSFNGRVIIQDKIDQSTTTEVTTAAGNWIESESLGIWFSRDNSATLQDAYFQDINGERFVYVSGSNAADDASIRGGRLSNVPITQGSVSPDTLQEVLDYGIRVKPNSTYKFKFDVYFTSDIVSSGNGRQIFHRVYGYRSSSTTSSNLYAAQKITNASKDQITTIEYEFTTGQNTEYISWSLVAGEQGAGNLLSEAWFKDISIEEVLPDRSTATTRSTASNRVKVRDMGTALRFDGVDDYVTLPTALNTTFSKLSSEFSISIMINPGNIYTDNSVFGSAISTSDRFAISINSSFLRAGIWNGATWVSGSGGKLLSPNVPVVFTFVSSGGIIVATYLNGVQYSPNGSQTPASSGGTGVVVGARSDTSIRFKGIIDEPRVWSRALTAQEVSDLYFADIVPRDGLVAEYLFNEASGTTALDTSGNGNNGTITDATYTLDVPLTLRDSI